MDVLFLKACQRKYVGMKYRKWEWPSATEARAKQYARKGFCHPFIRIGFNPTIKARHLFNKPYRKQRFNPLDVRGYL